MDNVLKTASDWLVQLPDPCLLAVLRCCAADPRSLFSAARAHSRLHQAAVLAASSIRAEVPQQQQADSVLLYLTNHGQHVGSLDLQLRPRAGATVILRQLPHSKLQGLSSLWFSRVNLQLQPGDGFQGVFGAGLPLKQLQLSYCTLLDGEEGLAAALALLPDLQHLSLVWANNHASRFPCSALQGLQQLTYLHLAGVQLKDPGGLQHLQGLTRLQDLRLERHQGTTIQINGLSGLQLLTCLKVWGSSGTRFVEPDVLAGKTQLQHLQLVSCSIPGGSAGVSQLLSNLQHLQQLTHLSLANSLRGSLLNEQPRPPGIAPAAAYSALTASSNLQHLNISGCILPVGVWQYVFPAGRQLPHLKALVMSSARHPSGPAGGPGGSLVSCCPGLQTLHMQGVDYSAELLASLTGLSGLQVLSLRSESDRSGQGLDVVCQLTGLRQLTLWDPRDDDGLLLRLTQLKQLTHLDYGCAGYMVYWSFEAAPNREPVWRQVARHHLYHRDPAVVQQADAALAE